ncbi:hypothetical protein [Mycolicibacterium mageritense]|uniref:hypothetical protein n=1 Tax=Mycolicibacterium mageritense TaxID=53462 RepID=UPI001E3B70A1|nr:hypothetical protein [Mycolicibacterium mageritense]GJJ21928.1 hypothetical protein MTY414_56010 [Mycolicibacterium mageritense]
MSQIERAVHRLDRSPFRLIDPDELVDVCGQYGLAVQTRTRLAGQVMQFSSR